MERKRQGLGEIKNGKPNIAPLNRLPLLSSKPGGFTGAGRTSLPVQT